MFAAVPASSSAALSARSRVAPGATALSAAVPRAGFPVVGNVVLELDGLRSNEATLEVGVDLASGLGRLQSFNQGPGT